MMYYGGPFMWYGWGFGWAIQAVIGILVFGFFLWMILHVVRSSRWNHIHSSYRRWRFDDEDAMDILMKRYARGEISKEEYESIKANLEKDMNR